MATIARTITGSSSQVQVGSIPAIKIQGMTIPRLASSAYSDVATADSGSTSRGTAI